MVGGYLDGYWGWFYSTQLGKVYVVATNMKNLTMIVVKSNGRKLIISPDENTLTERVNQRKGETTPPSGSASGSSARP
jgi:hypothetical protein